MHGFAQNVYGCSKHDLVVEVPFNIANFEF